MNRPKLSTWLLLFAGYTAIGTLFFASGYFDDLSRQHYGTAPVRATEEYVGAYTAFMLLPAIIWFARRFRICRENWPLTVALTILAALVYSGVHTTFNALGRDVVFRILGLGPYDYGIMLFRYPMEAAKDILYFFAMIGGIDFIDGLARARRAEIAAAELQTKLAEAKLENLRLQLHPHFLFNTLNAISSVMYEDVRKADEMLSKLSDFLRVVLASSNVAQVPLDEELAVERMYVDIMTTRLERRLRLDVRVDEPSSNVAVPFMLLQPLLENSIQHGMTGGRGSIDLSIDVRRKGGTTVIAIGDDGAGFDPQAARGIGLSNVASRLEHLYGNAASFTIAPRDGGGTLATICLPVAPGAPK